MGIRLRDGALREDYPARLAKAQRAGKWETVYPGEEACSREAIRTARRQPRILLTNTKQLLLRELLDDPSWFTREDPSD